MPLVLGITGSIATGKSLLCEHLVTKHGAIHGDADRLVHRMYDPGKDGFDRIVAEFGDEIVGEGGYIDRKILGGMVFGKPERMGALTKAIGDIAAEMKQTIDRWRAELGDGDIAILEAVNLIEAGYSEWTDATWLVAADDEVALPRGRVAVVEGEKCADAAQAAWPTDGAQRVLAGGSGAAPRLGTQLEGARARP